jgi:hypothetical protein
MNMRVNGGQMPPSADGFSICFCGECPCAHIVLRDEANKPFAQFTLTLEQSLKITAAIIDNNDNPRPIKPVDLELE